MAARAHRVDPHGSFRTGFDLVDASGATVGSFVGSAWRERGRIRDGGREWEFRRDGGKRFVLAGPAGVYAAADRLSLWKDQWRLSTGGLAYELVKPSWWSRGYELRAGGQPVGRFAPKGMFGTRADAELPAELPPAVRVFVVAVVMTIWRRQGAAAGTAAAGAAAAGSG